MKDPFRGRWDRGSLRPVSGFSAETAGAISIIGAAWGGIPVSTTHTITGRDYRRGSNTRIHRSQMGITRRIIWAWIITVPAAASIAAFTYLVIS